MQASVSVCSTPSRTSPTWNTPWSTPPSSRSIVTDRAQKGDFAPGLRQAIGRSKGGLTTKILALTDALGNLVRIVLLPGQRFDTVGVPPLIDGLAFGALIGDTAFDSNDIVADLNERGAKVVIAQHPRRTRPLAIDTEMYKWRHLIENFLCKLKEFKRIGGTVVADHASGEGGEDWREGDRSRYTVFQMAEVVVPRDLFRRIL